MNTKEYQTLALHSENLDVDAINSRFTQRINRLTHAAMGVCTESAELLDAIKKHLYYGKDLDTINIKEELGDIMWYIALACDTLDISLEDIMKINIEKLSKRYPEGYTDKHAINRNTEFELEHIS